MRKIITIAIIVATAAITTAWSMSTIEASGYRGATMAGGASVVPTRGVLSW